MAKVPAVDKTSWLDRVFEAKQVEDGGTVRRSVEDVKKYSSVSALKQRVTEQGFHLIRTGDQYVILCHKGDVRLLC